MAEKIHRIDKFQGLHDYADSSGNEGYTRDMKNVYVRYNRVFGRHGMTNLEVATDRHSYSTPCTLFLKLHADHSQPG